MSGTCWKCKDPKGTSNRRGMCSPCLRAGRKVREETAKTVLGHRCARCGITHPLVWDHINDDGYIKRQTRRSGRPEWAEFRRIIETGVSDMLQLLCPNCNHLKAHDRTAYDSPPAYGPSAVSL